MNRKFEEYKDALASLAKTDREALAAMIIEYIDPNHIAIDYVSMLLDTRSLNPGDQLFKRVRRGIVVRTLTPGAVHLASEVTLEDRAWYHLAGIDVKVHANEWDIESGQIGSLSDIMSEMRAQIQDHYINLVLTALTNLWTVANTPNNFVNVGGNITAAALETAIDYISYRVGAVKAVIGVRRLMSPITKFAQYTPYAASPTSWGVAVPSAIEEARQKGFVGTYYGATIIGLDQSWDNPIDNNTQLPEDKILVIGDNVGEFITYGEIKSKQWTNWDPTPPVFIMELYQQYGMIIDKQEGIYVIGGLTMPD